MVLSEGERSRGGIGRIATAIRDRLATDPANADIALSIWPSRLHEGGIKAHATTLGALIRFARACRRERFDVVHIHVAPRGSTWRKGLFAAAARSAGCRVILHLHGSAYDEWYATRSPSARRKVRRLFQRADAVVALGEYWRRFLIDAVAVPANRVHVIPNGVATVSQQGRPDAAGTPRIAAMGLVGERKGTDVLIEALGMLKARGAAFHAVIGGNGDVDWARALAGKAGVAEDILFTGWIGADAVQAHLRESALFVLASRQENQPMSILEAMAWGLPVVSTAIGAIPEQVEDGVSGLLVAPGDAAALADAIGRLLEDAALRAAMGAAGHARFAAHFSIELCARRFADLYRSLSGR